MNRWISWIGSPQRSSVRDARIKRRAPLRTFETLEIRTALAANSVEPAVAGTVFQDTNGNGQPSTGEGLSGVAVRLFQDDGDGVFELGSDIQTGSDLLTDSTGAYCFAALNPSAQYFVFLPAQTVAGNAINQQTSGLLSPGTPGLIIDEFATTQNAAASPPAPSSGTSVVAFANENEVIGRERDVEAELQTGDGEVRVAINPFNNRPTLRYNSDVAVTGVGTIVWDGQDTDASVVSMGLNGRDLTNAGRETGMAFWIGAVVAGSVARIRLYEGNTSNFSEATLNIPITNGGAAESYQFIPFSSFTGPVNPNNVDAIELVMDSSGAGANNVELAVIGTNGPKIASFLNVPSADLAITKTDNRADVSPGQVVTYTIVVTNNGPSAVTDATVDDVFPAQLTNVTFTSNATGTVSGNTASGSGPINDSISMAVGSTLTYTVQGTVVTTATGNFTNTATVTIPDGMTDPDLSNNSAIDVDRIVPTADLQITKTDNVTTVIPGRSVTYTITVRNNGPSDVTGATVTDNFPSGLLNVTYTSSGSAGVSGNTASASGNINDSVTLPVNGTLTYTVNATLAS